MDMMRIFLLALILGLVSVVSAQTSAEAELANRYYSDGEYESALELYDKVYKRQPEERFARQIVSCYEALNRFDDAIKFLEKVRKREKNAPIYPILQAGILAKTGELKASDKLYEEVIDKQLNTEGDFIKIGAYLYQIGALNWAKQTYLKARDNLRNEFVFSNELANIHEQLGEFPEAAKEYLNIYFADANNLNASNLYLLNMVSQAPPAQGAVEKVLLKAVDKYPLDLGLRTMLYEFYVQIEDFFESFVQVKSIDRLFREDGSRVFEFAKTMRNNEDYELSNEAFAYIIDKKKESPYFFQAHFEKATNGELQAFETIPVDMAAVQQAVTDYGQLLDEFGRRPQYFEAIYRRSNLMVFYLNELDVSLKELEQLVSQRQFLRADDWAKGKLLIGDILLMRQEYNEAKLTYNEVADNFKDRQTGALANYKLALLGYYKGEFGLAQALLGAIKDNTGNDISNDAIKLNLLIMDNTGLDSTTTALEMFAQAQLFTYQRQYDASLDLLDSLAFKFADHPIADEILWEKAQIALKRNQTDLAMSYIERILQQFPEDIFGDDALYTKARIYDFTLKQPEEAMKLYISFLSTYPGSLYSVEVRKRVRELRQG